MTFTMLPLFILSSLLTLLLHSTNANASPFNLVEELKLDPEFEDVLERRSHNSSIPFPVTGMSGAVYPRLEVRTMYSQQQDQWNLFLLALQRFKLAKQDRMLSYYQVAGIHGVPNVPWNGVGANAASGGAVGYCTHSSVLFPAWHRPYVVLFEQILMGHVAKVVKSFPSGPQRQKYARAAATMRLPFWDWAATPPNGQSTFPQIFTSQYITVFNPKGLQTIPNPLYRYSFHPLNPGDMIFDPWSSWPTTMRWPNSQNPDAVSQDDLAQQAIDNSRINIRDTLYNMFVNCGNYLEMSNDVSTSSTPGCSTSIESLHNAIHALVGGDNNGHMNFPWWSAFDPLFWLHHANVDRIFAMWQAIYPSSYGAYQIANGSTFTITQGSVQGPNSPLTPFFADSKGDFWTTNSVRQWSNFGYTYPEFVDSDGSASSIRYYVNSLYGPYASAVAGSSKMKRNLDLDLSLPIPIRLKDSVTTKSGATYEYIANVATPRCALNGSYSVYIFMGNPSSGEDASTWPFDENLIGSVRVFASPSMYDRGLISTGAIPLTRSLTSIMVSNNTILGAVLKDLNKISVVPFLQKTLQWRIATSRNQIVAPEDLPGFEVSVVTSEAEPADSKYDFPIYKPFNFLPDITNGKKGGLKFGQASACQSV